MQLLSKLSGAFVAIWIMSVAIIPMTEGALLMQQTPKPGLYLKQWMSSLHFSQKALVMLDLNDTTITTKNGQWLGRSEMFYYLMTKELKNNPDKNKAKVVEELDPLLTLVYERMPLQLTDPRLPEVIRQLKAKGVTVIGVTARGLALTDVTMKQLQTVGVEFTDTGPSQMLNMPNNKPVRIEHGVVMAGVTNKKGDVVKALLKNKVINQPDQIMLVDDRKKHLITVSDAVRKYDPNMPHTSVLCTHVSEREAFNPEESEQQLLEFIYQWRNDKKLSNLVQRDAFSKRFLSHCHGMNLHDPKHCDELLQQFGIKAVND